MVYFSVEEKVSCVNIFTTNFSPTVHYRMRTSLFATFSLLLLTVLPVNSGNETHSFFLFSQFVANRSWIIEFDLKHSSSIAPLVTTSSNKLFSISFPFELHTAARTSCLWNFPLLNLKLPIRHTHEIKKQRYTWWSCAASGGRSSRWLEFYLYIISTKGVIPISKYPGISTPRFTIQWHPWPGHCNNRKLCEKDSISSPSPAYNISFDVSR